MERVEVNDVMRWLASMSPKSQYAISKTLGKSSNWLNTTIRRGGVSRLDTVVDVARCADLRVAFIDARGDVVGIVEDHDARDGSV